VRALPPITVDATTLTSTTVSEPDTGETAWSSGSTYVLGDRVINTTTHRTYESQQGVQKVVTFDLTANTVAWVNHGLAPTTAVVFTTTGTLPTGITAGVEYYVLQDTSDTFKISANKGGSEIDLSGSPSGTHTATASPNKGHDPTTDDGTWWADVGPTNKWAMWDLLRSTATVAASPLVVEVTPGQRIDACALVGLEADEALIEAIVDSVVIKSWEIPLRYRIVTSWYEHLTTPFTFQNVTAIWDVPAITDLVLRITLTRATGDVVCGGVVMGRQAYLGEAQYGAENDATNYSRITTDDDGNTTLNPRRSVPRTRQNVRFLKDRSAKLLELRRLLNAKPAFWSAVDDPTNGYFEPLQILGFYDGFTMTFDQPSHGLLALSLKEL
jgi:hypothetical protein